MAKQLTGKEVAEAMVSRLCDRTAALRDRGVIPTLAIVRIGEKPEDMSYERGAVKRADAVGVAVRQFVLPDNVTKEEVLSVIDGINEDGTIHGALLFRPLPAHLKKDQQEICNRLAPHKDVDGMTDIAMAGIFTGKAVGYPPCTPAACMEILEHYGYDCTGKNAVVLGRSLVIGKPLAMLLMAKNATVTVCHTRSKDIPGICRQADLIVSAVGVLHFLTAEYVRPGQTVLDVSINYDPEKPNAKGGVGGIAGDAVFDEVAPVVDAITPVPGGVGAVTTAVLMKHVVEAAEKGGAA